MVWAPTPSRWFWLSKYALSCGIDTRSLFLLISSLFTPKRAAGGFIVLISGLGCGVWDWDGMGWVLSSAPKSGRIWEGSKWCFLFFWNGKARLRYVTPYGLVGFYGVGFGGSVGALRFSLAGLIFF
jgi:hypothetical protein